MDETPQDRARRRANWPVAKYRLGDEPDEDLSASTTAEERVGMMLELALRSWALAGRPIREYRRDQIPGRVLRPNPK